MSEDARHAPHRPFQRADKSRWGVNNFKAIEATTIDIGQLGLLTGANSSGKSSMLQSLLFLAQSRAESQLVLNGALVTLGEGPDVVRLGQDVVSLTYGRHVNPFGIAGGEPVAASITIELLNRKRELSVQSLSLEVDHEVVVEAVHQSDSGKLTPPSPASRTQESDRYLRVTHLEGAAKNTLRVIEMNGLIPETMYIKRSARRRRAEAANVLRLASNRRPFEMEMLITRSTSEKAIPRVVMDLRNGIWESRRRRVPPRRLPLKDLSDSDYGQLLQFLAESPGLEWEEVPLTRSFRTSTTRSLRDQTEALNTTQLEATYYLSQCSRSLGEFAGSLRYVGPLRDEPRVVSPLGRGNRYLPVGARGEFTADLLVRRGSQVCDHRGPTGESLSEPLIEAVSRWVSYLGIGTRISVSDRGKLGRSVGLVINGVERDLTMVGVGASQLLPVVTAVLGVDSGSILLLEQPELHLHPAVQSRLGDFLATARPDVSLLVETHSECLVNRLRLRVVQRKVEPTAIAIYFAEQRNGVARFRSLELNAFGDLNEWPQGFFDEGESDSGLIVRELARRSGVK